MNQRPHQSLSLIASNNPGFARKILPQPAGRAKNSARNMLPNQGTDARFTPTQWGLVLAAKAGDAVGAAAMNELCGKYWYPAYAFIRRQGCSPHDAEDLVQGFFDNVLRRDWLANVGPEKGKFRNFLLACLKNHRINQIEKDKGPMRNPGQPVVSFDLHEAERCYALEPRDEVDPAVLFDRRWAMTLVERVLAELKAQYAAKDKTELFDMFYPFLIGNAERGDFAPAAAKLNMNEGAVRKAVTDLRKRFRELLLEEIAQTVKDPADVEEERAYLLRLFGR